MPFNPIGANFDIGGSVRAGQDLVSPLQAALQKYEEDRRKAAFADASFDFLKSVPGAVSVEALDRYHKMSGSQKYETVIGAASNAKMIAAQQAQEREQRQKQAELEMRWKIASMRDAPDPDAAKAVPLIAPDGTVVPGQFYNPGSKQIIKTTDTKAVDDWKKLNADSKAISGVGIGDWTRATDHRIENGMFTADLPGVPAPPGTPPAAIPYVSKPGRKLQMPTHEYDSLLSRYNQLSQGSGAPSAPSTPPTGEAAAASGGVRVKRPDGQVGMIPADQLPTALAQGYTQLQ